MPQSTWPKPRWERDRAGAVEGHRLAGREIDVLQRLGREAGDRVAVEGGDGWHWPKGPTLPRPSSLQIRRLCLFLSCFPIPI